MTMPLTNEQLLTLTEPELLDAIDAYVEEIVPALGIDPAKALRLKMSTALRAGEYRAQRNQLMPRSNPDRLPVRWCGNAWDHGEHVVTDGPEPFFCPGDGMGG